MTEIAKDFHQAAGMFHLVEGDDFAALVEDIRTNGLRHPIVLHPDGSILDGRNRYRACLAAGVDPQFRTYEGDTSTVALFDYVLSTNLYRRHVNSGQRAAAIVQYHAALETERTAAKERQREGGRAKVVQCFAQAGDMSGRVVEQLAKKAQTNRVYVQECLRLQREDPETLAAIRCGKRKITDVIQERKTPRRQFHPITEIIPLTGEGNERIVNSLADSVREFGLINPITILPDGRILDGRLRYLACLKAGIEPRYETYTGDCDDDSLIRFIVSKNIRRSHFATDQCAMITARMNTLTIDECAAEAWQ